MLEQWTERGVPPELFIATTYIDNEPTTRTGTIGASAEHYETHLAPIYTWMVGGVEAAVAKGDSEIARVLPDLTPGMTAIDLGAGFGMHSIPLARRGCSVLAVDTSSILLSELRAHAGDLPIRTVDADLLSFQSHVTSAPRLILCMGDTLTHLPTRSAVEILFASVADALTSGGVFVTSFRDYTRALEGTSRFILVKSDAARILTCFLEYATETVMVHDIIHEQADPSWRMRVSAYPKLRLAPAWVIDKLRERGFSSVRSEAGLAGMVRLVATRS
jgi:2-polyprenyl-3-methyl-5-hydroxy-6-metoxy-1,4-benzoquinol methylase